MTPAHLSSILAGIAPALGNHLWQSTLFAVAAGLLTLTLRRNRAGARYWLWLAASLKFLIPFSLLVSIGSHLAWPHASATTSVGFLGAFDVAMNEVSQQFTQAAGMPISAATARFSESLLHLLPAILVTAWLSGFAAVILIWCLRWRRISAAMREGVPLREGREVDTLRRIERIAGTPKPIEIVLSRTSLEPGIFGIARSTLLWPQGISQHLEDAHLEAVLAHEVWHVRRRDNLAAAFHMLVEAIFWFHPLVWWLGARLVDERERACDEEVLELGGERHVYAESILKVCEFCVGSRLACVSGVTGSDLKKRMVNIMNQRIARKLDFSRKLLLSIAGVLAFALPITFGLVNAPRVRAQEQAENANSTTPVYTVSIKPSEVSTPTYAGTRTHMVKMMYSPDGFTAANAALQTIIQDAYGVQASQIVGAPDWLNTAAYDMEFKIDNSGANEIGLDQSLPRSQRVLQTILADRFKLKIHRESRELPSYALIVGEDGPKLQPAKGGDTYASGIKARDGQPMGPRRMMMQLGNGQVIGIGAQGTSMADLAQQLSQQLGVPVVDKTGLTGGYDFDLHWSPDASGPDKETDNNPTPSSAAHESSGTALLSAIQEQLGLKLEPQKSQMPILVIEHVEKVQTPPAS